MFRFPSATYLGFSPQYNAVRQGYKLKKHEIIVAPCQSLGRSLWHHQGLCSSSPSVVVCRWSQTVILCSVKTCWSTSLRPPSTAQCAPQRPETLWCSGPAAADSSPAACHGWWSYWLFGHVLPTLYFLLWGSRCRRVQVCVTQGLIFRFLECI